MAFNERSLDDYVDVAQRIADFRTLYPEGSLQPLDPAHPWEQATVTGVTRGGEPFTATMIVYVAAAYRTPDDQRPGIGCAWEVFPGRTPYTLGSELMNAETSAWGRAVIAVLASDSKAGVASRQEVKARRAERDDGLPVNADGSLSRSRTTDAEKAAAGVMTAGQLAEHTALGGGNPKTPKAERDKVTRIGPHVEPHDEGTSYCTSIPGECPLHPGAGRDPWLDQPAAPLDVPTEDKPGSIGPAQRRTIMAAFGKDADRNARLAKLSSWTGREITSTNDLSFLEAKRILGLMARASESGKVNR